MKRPAILLTLMLVLALLVSGCAVSVEAPAAPAAGDAAAGEAAAEEVTVYFYQRGYVEGGEDAGSINTDKAIEAFEAANPGVNVEVIGIPWTEEGNAKLELALADGSAINVFRVTSTNIARYARQGILSDIEPFLSDEDKADFYESAFQVAELDGKVWAYPLWVTAISIFANTELFEAQGVELPTMEDPWTWDEFVEAAKTLTFERDGQQVYGFTSSSKQGAIEYYPIMYLDGGRIVSADGSRFVQNQPEGVSALQKLADLALVHQVTPPDFGTVDQPIVRAQFKEQQNVAMLMSTPGFIPDLEGSEFPFVVIPPPTGETGSLVTNGAFGLFAVVDVEDQAVLEASHKLANYLTSAQVAEDVEGWQLAPGLRRSNNAYATTPNRQTIVDLVEFGVYEAPVGVSGEVQNLHGAALQSVILGVSDPQTAMDELAPVYQAELDALTSE
jgi:multiple sugar transport system substrate-binding protein